MSNIVQLQPFYLNQPLGATDTQIQVRGLKDSRGRLITAMPSGVAKINFTIEPLSANNQEIASFTGITDNGNGVVTLTGVTRNLNPVSPFTAMTADVPHANNVMCVIGDNPQVFQDVVMTNEARTVSAVVTFSASPIVPSGVNPTEAVNKSQLDAVVLGQVPSSSTTVNGSVRMASSQYKTLGTATMTIASPCVVTFNSHGLIANDTVVFTTTGALPTGLAVNTAYYVMSTGLTTNTFQVSATLSGTAINTSGSQSGTHTLYRTTPYAVNDQDPRLPTQSENDAMAGTSGTPSSSNKFVTNADTTGTGAVLRTSAVSFISFGSGADGSLTFDGVTTVLGLVPSSNIYTLTRDIYGTTVVVNGGVTIETAGYRIFASTSLANAGTIKRTPNNGGNASGATAGTAGAALAAGTLYGGLAGQAGGTGAVFGSTGGGTVAGSAGGNGTSNVSSVGVNGAAGGSGGTGSNGGTAGTATASKQGIYNAFFATAMFDFTAYTTVSGSAGSGAGGAGGYTGPTGAITTGGGGGSGSAGGVVFISAKTLTNTGTISANGGNGGNGAASTGAGATGGGGGAGGSGGVVVLIYNSITLGTVTVTGGTGGTNGGGSGAAGSNGGTGVIIQITA